MLAPVRSSTFLVRKVWSGSSTRGPLSVDDALGDDRKGWLEWSVDAMRASVGARAGPPMPACRPPRRRS